MITIRKEKLTEEEAHHFSAEAAELGLYPGMYLECFEVYPKIGNGMPFYLSSSDHLGWKYMQSGGCVLIRIFND